MSTANAVNPTSKVVALHSVDSTATRKFEVTCSSCNLRELCLPKGLAEEDMARVERIVYARRRVRRGEALFNAGDEFHSVYAVRSGFFKTTVLNEDGREQVTGFNMPGELIGMDGIGTGSYHGNAVALEDCEVCVLPFSLIVLWYGGTQVAGCAAPTAVSRART